MGEPNPFASKDAGKRVVVRERDGNAAHRNIAEDDRQQKSRHNKEEIQLPVLPDVNQRIVKSGILAFLRSF